MRGLRKLEQSRKLKEALLASGQALNPQQLQNAIDINKAMEAGYRRELGLAPTAAERRERL